MKRLSQEQRRRIMRIFGLYAQALNHIRTLSNICEVQDPIYIDRIAFEEIRFAKEDLLITDDEAGWAYNDM